MPDVYNQLREITSRLEKHYRDMQDFRIHHPGRPLYMLQTRNGKRTGRAAVRVAIDMVNETLISRGSHLPRGSQPALRLPCTKGWKKAEALRSSPSDSPPRPARLLAR